MQVFAYFGSACQWGSVSCNAGYRGRITLAPSIAGGNASFAAVETPQTGGGYCPHDACVISACRRRRFPPVAGSAHRPKPSPSANLGASWYRVGCGKGSGFAQHLAPYRYQAESSIAVRTRSCPKCDAYPQPCQRLQHLSLCLRTVRSVAGGGSGLYGVD